MSLIRLNVARQYVHDCYSMKRWLSCRREVILEVVKKTEGRVAAVDLLAMNYDSKTVSRHISNFSHITTAYFAISAAYNSHYSRFRPHNHRIIRIFTAKPPHFSRI